MARKGWSHPNKEMRLYLDALRREFLEVCEYLSSGNIADLEFAAEIVDEFPHGKGGFFGDPWIIHAIDCGSIESIEWMIQKGVDLRPVVSADDPPLNSCVELETKNKHKILKILIDAGADINERGSNGWTPLHLAAIRDDEKSMQILLEAGADRSIRTNCDYNNTAEEEARALDHEASANFIANFQD